MQKQTVPAPLIVAVYPNQPVIYSSTHSTPLALNVPFMSHDSHDLMNTCKIMNACFGADRSLHQNMHSLFLQYCIYSPLHILNMYCFSVQKSRWTLFFMTHTACSQYVIVLLNSVFCLFLHYTLSNPYFLLHIKGDIMFISWCLKVMSVTRFGQRK